jgi:hypothetical protein
LKNVEILSNLSSVAGSVFKACIVLEYVIFRGSIKVPSLEGTDAFDSTTCLIYVPDNLYDQWIAATNWSAYADRIKPMSEYVEPTNNE